MRYLLAVAVLTLASCSTDLTAPSSQPSFDSGNSCNDQPAKAACTGQNPSKHNP